MNSILYVGMDVHVSIAGTVLSIGITITGTVLVIGVMRSGANQQNRPHDRLVIYDLF